MPRVLEPEVMDEEAQCLAYAQADFSRENQTFVDLFRQYFPDLTSGHVLDLGCGPADIPIRFVRALPGCRVTGIDASPTMIRLGETAVRDMGLADRIALQCAKVQGLASSGAIPDQADAIMSNSLLHHLPNPLAFWFEVKRLAKPGSPVLVMDLLRPDSPETAHAIVDRYAADAPAILKRDFYNSLLAAFADDEVAAQLAEMNLSRLLIDVIDDRHWVVGGLVL